MLELASKIATSNTSRVFSKDLFLTTFSPALGDNPLSTNDLSVLLKYLSRDTHSIFTNGNTIKFIAPSEIDPVPITEEDISIARLRSLITSTEPQIQQLTARISELDQSAREAVINKQPTTAKSYLRLKKLADEKLRQRTATLTQLEEIYGKIEQAADQVDIVRVMESSSKTLKSLNAQTGGVEKVQDIVDGLREEMTSADEINQVLNEVSGSTVDEAEVDDELEALEKAEKEKQEAIERQEQERRELEEAENTKRKLAELEYQPAQAKAAEHQPLVDRTNLESEGMQPVP